MIINLFLLSLSNEGILSSSPSFSLFFYEITITQFDAFIFVAL